MAKSAYWVTGALVLVMGTAGIAAAHGKGGDRGGMGLRGAGFETMIEQLDANGDGAISAEEIAAASAKRFSDADTDGDGFLSPEELTASAEKMRSEREGKMRQSRFERMFERMDADDDGKLSAEELAARGPARMLTRMDANEDGTISAEELAAVKERMAQRGERGHGKRGGHDGGKRGMDNN